MKSSQSPDKSSQSRCLVCGALTTGDLCSSRDCQQFAASKSTLSALRFWSGRPSIEQVNAQVERMKSKERQRYVYRP